MKHILVLCLLLAAASSHVAAQSVDATVCEILANPKSFDGKIVKLNGTVSAGFDEFAIKDTTCNQPVNAIWLAYPAGAKAKAGPAALVQLQLARNSSAPVVSDSRSAVKLDKNKDFKQFDLLLSTPYKTGGMCLGCIRYTVTATLIGRLDGVQDAGLVRDSARKFVSANGFGNLNQYRARLVLQSVSDVVSHEIDYAKNMAALQDDSKQDAAVGDPVAAAHQAARAFKNGSPAANQLEQAAAA